MIAVTAAVIAGVVGVRVRLAAMPLERDEGEYACMGWLMTQGVPPYAEAWHMKLPGIYAAYAAILSVFGPTATAIRIGLIIVNLADAALLACIVRRWSGWDAGLLSGCTYLVLSVQPAVQGVAANAEHFVLLPALAGLAILPMTAGAADESDGEGRRPRQAWRLLAGGFMLGLAFVVKQQGIVFAACGAAWVALDLARRRFSRAEVARRLGLFVGAAALPFAAVCILMAWAGAFPRFAYWTLVYPLHYGREFSWHDVWIQLRLHGGEVLAAAWPVWLAAGTGLILSCRRQAGGLRGVALAFAIAAMVGLTPGWRFFPHYFVLALPAAAWLFAYAVNELIGRPGDLRPIRKGLIAVSVAVLWALPFLRSLDFFFATPVQACRILYDVNPFPESVEIGAFLRDHTAPQERIAVLGSEPQIYFYAQRRPAHGFLHMYPLVENHGRRDAMQQELIGQIMAADPRYVVCAYAPSSWCASGDQTPSLFSWFAQYRRSHLRRAAIIEVLADRTISYWGPAAAAYVPQGRNCVEILERRP